MPEPQVPSAGRLAIAASFTAEPVLPSLALILEEARLPLEVVFAPYHQVFQELLSGTSLLARNAGGVNVVFVRLEDYVRDVSDPESARGVVEKTARELSEALGQQVRRVKEPTILAVFPPSPAAASGLRGGLEKAGAELVESAGAIPGIHLLTPGDIEPLATGERHDRLRDQLAHIPFTEDYYASIALALARKVHALRVPAHKVLVLDCDQTLWQGVVGEDGVEGISMPQRLLEVQRFAVEQQARGTLVCLASKNAERDVLEVFEKRPEMVLRMEHVVAHRINWEPKPANLVSLARELNLGLDAFVFLDDNPVECAQMKAELPQVVALQLPENQDVEAWLSRLWTFDRIALTSEDVRRTALYRENAARKRLEESATDISEFLASLGIVIDIAPPADGEWPRVAQLTQRTNQFNFTTKRRTESEMRALPGNGARVLRVNVRDRFGDYGLVGVMIARAEGDELGVDTLLLSCRVLGRGVEHAMLRQLGDLAQESNLSSVALPYLPTPKNEPARSFAESVAARFASAEGKGVVYRIPVPDARAIQHRPGQDPEAVIRARDAEVNKGAADKAASSEPPSPAPRSDRYAALAGTLISGRAVVEALRARNKRRRALAGDPQGAATKTEGALLALWEELLGIEGLGVEDDYFALGGTSLLAAQVFAEIERRFGVRLRLTAILEAPTVRALARRLEPESPARAGGLVTLKRGGGRKLFLVHDGDGETLLYLNLARRLPEEYSVFGIEPRRLPGVPLAHARIEDMAEFYIGEMRKEQPRGPYLVGGLCAGGVIAYEMSAQLGRAGETAGLVALFDAAHPRAEKRRGRIAQQRLGRMAQVFAEARSRHPSILRRAVFIVGEVFRKGVNTLAWEVGSRGRRLSTRLRFRLLRGLLQRGRPWPSFLKGLSIREIYDSAEAAYVPPPVQGAGVVLLRAREGQGNDVPYREVYEDGTFGWGAVAPGLAVVDVEGGHASMLQEAFVGSIASALVQQLPAPPSTALRCALSGETARE
jgi:FkbH-like protein